ncbi:MAG: Hsp20/alpha crystallin family protein [Candidatus Liptonbacteria bacterium]|nr:Hsp20/alpha crystallin family protein [Candidatus Liptonbacteria bacterium]
MADENKIEEGADAEVAAAPEVKVELTKAGAAVATRAAKERASQDDEPEGQLTIDVYQTPSEIVIESTIAGVNPEDLDIDVTNDSVTIRGARKREKEVKDEDYFYRECYWGRFSRSVILPQEINPEDAEVSFKNGILSIRLPKLVRRKSKKLKIKAE